MEEVCRPHRITKPPRRHEDMVPIPLTSSSSDDLSTAFSSNLNNDYNISTIRAALHGCAVVAGTDEVNNQADGHDGFTRYDSFDERNYYNNRTDSNGHNSFLTHYNFDVPNRLNETGNGEQNDATDLTDRRAQDVVNESWADLATEENRRTRAISPTTPPVDNSEPRDPVFIRRTPSPASSASVKKHDELLQKILRSVKKLTREQKELKSFVTNAFETISNRLDGLDGAEFPEKPECLPFRKISHITRFEDCSEEELRRVIHYLSSLGGTDFRSCASLMIKEAIHDRLAPKINYYGRHEGTFPLEKTKLMKALYKAMSRRLRDPMMALSDFSSAALFALRAAKQRRRTKTNNRKGANVGEQENIE